MRSARFRVSPSAATAGILLFFFFCLAFFGGASRFDALSQAVVRLAAVLTGAATLLFVPSADDRFRSRVPLAFLLSWAVMIAAQLIPLPPAIWTGLPGREFSERAAMLAGSAQPWRPLSLSPDLTLNSLLALLVPLSAIMLSSRLSRASWWFVLLLLFGTLVLSTLFGVAQLAGVRSFYFYRVTNEGSAVGLFANRNHNSLLLTIGLPLMAVLLRWPLSSSSRVAGLRLPIAAITALLIVPLVIVSGSRAALLLLPLSAAAALLILRTPLRRSAGRSGAKELTERQGRLLTVASVGAIVGLAILSALGSRAESIQRLISSQFALEDRSRSFETVRGLAAEFFPAGAGFGTFDPIYRSAEPIDLLSSKYLNHAHNDWLEVVIEGGLPALVLILAFAAWFMWRTVRHWWPVDRATTGHLLGRLGSVTILQIVASSAVDYPLRTPILAVLFALGTCMLAVDPSIETVDEGRRRSRRKLPEGNLVDTRRSVG